MVRDDVSLEEITSLFKQAIQSSDNNRAEICSRIIAVADQSSEFKGLLGYSDVDQAVSVASKFLKIDPSNDEILNGYLKKVLEVKEYHFYYLVNRTANFPDNYIIGHCVCRNFAGLPKNIQNGFEMTWINNYQLFRGVWSDLERYLGSRKQATFLEVVAKACGQFKAAKEAESQVEQALDILRMSYQDDFVATEYYMELGSNPIQIMRGPIHGEYEAAAGSRLYSSANDERISTLNRIVKEEGSEMLRRLRIAARLFGSAVAAKNVESRYTLLCAAMDAMVMESNEVDYHGEKLAELTSFLISEPEKRPGTFMQVSQSYNSRPSAISKDSGDVSEDKMKTLQEIMLKLFWRLAELERKGHLSLSDGDNSVMNFVRRIKFGIKSPTGSPVHGLQE